jgi:hypothetical protein
LADPLTAPMPYIYPMADQSCFTYGYNLDAAKAMLAEAGFQPGTPRTWKLTMAFDSWIARIRTPQVRADAIRDLFDRAADEARTYFAVAPDHSFAIDAMLIEAA